MVDNHFRTMYSVLIGFFTSMVILLMIVLFIEYRFFCKRAGELLILKQQYSYYIDILEKRTHGQLPESLHEHENEDDSQSLHDTHEILDEISGESAIIIHDIAVAEISDAPDNDDEYLDDSFVVINRHPDYLKQSTIDYMESQELNALMTAIDIDRWADYTQSCALPAQQSLKPKQVPAQSGSPLKNNQRARGVEPKKGAINPAIRRPIKDCGFIWPIGLNKFWLSSLFGPRKRIDGSWGFHHGIDMAAIKGTEVRSARAGTVVEASFQTGYGNTVVVSHTDTIKTRYAHLHTIRVAVGQKIKQGVVVGTVGETGFIRKKGKDGSHLHFEVYEYGKRINPLNCLPRMT
jgi:murein DD-endopeptidase MepM/ murein hydrolase activator NlpD